MKNVRFFLGVLLIFVLASCSNELLEVETPSASTRTKVLNVFGHAIEQNDNVLSFQNADELKEALSKIEQAQLAFKSSSKNLNLANGDVTFAYQGFRSMYDVFDEAMGVAPEYYGSRESYEVFKTKYSSLYFPEVGDDYAAYLPISDKNLAKLANAEGFIQVGEDLIDCKDISDYETLVGLGLTPPNEKLRSKEVFNYKSGDTKLWINYSTDQSKTTYKFEVCFRDKGFMGIWYNRKASSSLSCARCDIAYVSEPPTAWNIGNSVKKSYDSSFSSHDYEFAAGSLVGGGSEGLYLIVKFGPWGNAFQSFVVSLQEKP